LKVWLQPTNVVHQDDRLVACPYGLAQKRPNCRRRPSLLSARTNARHVVMFAQATEVTIQLLDSLFVSFDTFSFQSIHQL
jgi:hypothetical protein